MTTVKLYKTILADPPWREQGGGKIVRGANRHYALMKTSDIAALPVAQHADAAGCHLYLWTTNGFLPDAIHVMRSWGFRYVTCVTWAKDRFGIGQYFRGQTEQCLFGVMGNVPYKRDSTTGKRIQGRTLLQAKRLKHSQKPEAMRQMIERVSEGPFLELFARQKAPGWDVWGDEMSSSDIVMGQP